MPEMKSLTLNDKTYDGFVDPVARALAGATTVINSASGESVTLSDASNSKLLGLSIYGKTTQDGTPTPDAPVDLVSVGDGGSVEVALHGENIAESIYVTDELEQYNTAFYIETTLCPSTTYTLSFHGTSGNVYYTNEYVFEQAWVTVQDGITTVTMTTKSTLNNGATTQYRDERGWAILKNGKTNSAHVFSSVMLKLGAGAKEYETPKDAQTISLTTPLRAIPVTDKTLATYTDVNGQMWCADEIDFARGVYVQRIAKIVPATGGVYGTYEGQTPFGNVISEVPLVVGSNLLCSHLQLSDSTIYSSNTLAGACVYGEKEIRFRLSATNTADEITAFISNDSVEFLCVLATPIETPLPEEDLVTYADLHTYRDHTTVSNDASAHMELEYAMDAKKYIDSLIGSGGSGGASARLASVTLRASAWTGADSLFSQVVTVAGVTPYSKVDLLPSVEQLAIFYNKDVTFLTENEGGVVTVYAIGEKPVQDYTMQVQITEVVV